MPEPLVQRAVWLLETRLDDDVALPALAAELGVSPYHLCRAFVAGLGQSPMRYLRRRRLSRAVALLSERRASIQEIALASGYASQASFTRRFSATFGMTPGRARREAATITPELQEPIVMSTPTHAIPRPARVETRPAFMVAGIAERYTLETNGAIPGQWAAFVPRIPEIVGLVDDRSYGVCFGSAADGSFAYMTAVAVDPRASLPPGMTALRIGPARYAVFEHRGSAATLRDTVVAVWDRGLAASGLAPADIPDFEAYPEAYDPTDETACVEIWIPLRDETSVPDDRAPRPA